MKKTAILMLGFVLVVSQSCQQKKAKDNQINVETVNNEVKTDPNKMVFGHLDQILSPFEDMTESALNKNEEGILKSLAKIETAIKESVFENNLDSESFIGLNPKIEVLKTVIKEKNYSQIALISTEIFKYNVTNFADAKKIENQV